MDAIRTGQSLRDRGVHCGAIVYGTDGEEQPDEENRDRRESEQGGEPARAAQVFGALGQRDLVVPLLVLLEGFSPGVLHDLRHRARRREAGFLLGSCTQEVPLSTKKPRQPRLALSGTKLATGANQRTDASYLSKIRHSQRIT
eukprot:scaffold6091_cov60-Phaeocystis_antarctica.AAC.2